jgi:predicted nucleic acid-binding protein
MKVFIDSCFFIEIILHQPLEEKCSSLLNGFSKNELYISPRVITEVSCRIDKEVSQSFIERTYVIEEHKNRDMLMMKKEFYSIFESLLERCYLITENKEYKQFSKVKSEVDKLRFNTVKSDSDKKNLIIAITGELDSFVTLDKPIAEEKGKIKGISSGKLEVELIK